MPDEDDDQGQDDPAGLRDRMRRLEKELSTLRPEAAKGADATKKLAIYEAGVSDPKTVKLLAKVHEGEWTPEAIRATVAEYGFGAAPETNGTEPDERQAAIDALGAVASGTRGTADTRKPTANDDEAINEELLELMAEIPEKGKLADRNAYLDRLNKLMNKYEVRRS